MGFLLMMLQRDENTNLLLTSFFVTDMQCEPVSGLININRLTVRAVCWVVLRPGVFVDHKPSVEGVCRTLSAAGSSLGQARVRRQGMVTQVARRGIGAQRQRLL